MATQSVYPLFEALDRCHDAAWAHFRTNCRRQGINWEVAKASVVSMQLHAELRPQYHQTATFSLVSSRVTLCDLWVFDLKQQADRTYRIKDLESGLHL